MKRIFIVAIIVLIFDFTNNCHSSPVDEDTLKQLYTSFLYNQYREASSTIKNNTHKNILEIQKNISGPPALYMWPFICEPYKDEEGEVIGRRTTFQLQNCIWSPELITLHQEASCPQSHKLLVHYPHQEVGKVVILENPEERDHKGKFVLELIAIHEEFQNQGFGSQALHRIKELTAFLTSTSPFYQELSLLCTDPENVECSAVPYRLSFYLNHGFKLDPRSEELLKFLSLNHFVQHLDEEQFSNYLVEYNLIDPVKPHKVLKRHALKKLKERFPLISLDLDELLQRAELNSSVTAQQILNRAFYDAYITDEEQDSNGHYAFKLSLNIHELEKNIVERKKLIAARQASGFKPKELTLKAWKANSLTGEERTFSLLKDQHKLNNTLKKLIQDLENAKSYKRPNKETFSQASPQYRKRLKR